MFATQMIRLEDKLDVFDDYVDFYNSVEPKKRALREKLEFTWMLAQAGAVTLSLMTILVIDEIALNLKKHPK